MAVTVSWTADGPEFGQPRELFGITNGVFVIAASTSPRTVIGSSPSSAGSPTERL